MATKNLLVRAGADFSGLKKSMERTQQQLKRFKDSVNNSMTSVNLALAGIGAGLGVATGIKDAMEFEAHIGTLNQTLGESTKGFEEWMNTVGASLGISKLQLAKYGNQYSLTLKGIAKDQDDLAKKTQKTIEAVALIRSKTGMEVTEISDRMRSAMNGEADGADELGVNVRVAAIEASKAYKMMSNGQPFSALSAEMQKTIRWQYTMDTVTQNLGNTMANNTSMKMARFQGSLLNLRMALGQAWLPILSIALPALTKLSNSITKVLTVFAQFMSALFGYKADSGSVAFGEQAESADTFGNSVSGVGDAYKQASKEAKKAKGSLAGFDEVNTLADKTGANADETGSGGSDGSASIPTTPVNFETNASSISSKIQEMANKTKGFFKAIGQTVSENKNIIVAALGGIGAGLATYVIATKGATLATTLLGKSSKAFGALKAAMMFLISPVGLIVAAIALLTAGFIYFYRTNDKFKGFVDGILNKIKDAAIYLWKNALVPLGDYIGKGFTIAVDASKKSLEWLWKNVFVPFGGFLKDFYKTVLVPLGHILKDVLSIAFKTVSDVAKSFWKNVLVPLGDFIKSAFKPTVEAMSTVFKVLWKEVLQPLGAFLGDTFRGKWTSLTSTLTILWKNVLKPLAEFLGGHFSRVFDTVFKGIGGYITGLKTAFIGLMTFITGVFTKDWSKAWNGVQMIFKGVFEGLWSIAKTPLNLMIDGINTLIGGLNKLNIPKIKIPGIGEIGGWGINIPKIPKLARGGIVNTATNMGNYIAGEAGTEMIVPLENTAFVQKLANAIGVAVGNQVSKNSGSSGDVVIKVGETEIARVVSNGINKLTKIDGKLPINI